MMNFEIVPLPKEKWKGTVVPMRYTTREYFDLELTVTELWVDDRFHRRGFGTRLMDLAKEKAKEQGRRAIILETQSCNVRAIAFYRRQGFRLIGFDACCYTNNDEARHEVRFNFGYFLNSHP